MSIVNKYSFNVSLFYGTEYLLLGMKSTKLADGTKVFCLRAPEAKMLDHHVDGYLQNGIEINDGDVIFDVGANIGVFGVRAVQKFPNTQVYCFEPIPDIYEVLKGNAELHSKDRFHVLPYGISDTNETVEFSYYPNTPALSTFHPEDWDSDPKAFQRAVKGSMKNPPPGMGWLRLIPTFFSGIIAKNLVKGKKQVKCQIRNTSDVIKELGVDKIDLLKIDCEGAELGVVKGINSEDWKKVKATVIEVHDNEGRLDFISNLLKENGFSSIHIEKEQGLEETKLYNIFATRS